MVCCGMIYGVMTCHISYVGVPNGGFGGIGRNRMMQSRKRLSVQGLRGNARNNARTLEKNTKGKTTCRQDEVIGVKGDGGLEVGIDRSWQGRPRVVSLASPQRLSSVHALIFDPLLRQPQP